MLDLKILLTKILENISSLNDDVATSEKGAADYVSNAQFANANGIRYAVRGKMLSLTINAGRTSGAASLSDFVPVASIPYVIDNRGSGSSNNNAFYVGIFANTTATYQLRFRPVGSSGITYIDFYAANTTAGIVRFNTSFALI